MEGPHRNVFFRHLLPRRGPSCVASRRAARCSLVYRAASFLPGRRRPQTLGRRWAGAPRTWSSMSAAPCCALDVCQCALGARRLAAAGGASKELWRTASFRRLRAPGPTLRMALWEQPVSLGSEDRHTSSSCKRKHNPCSLASLGAKVCTNWSLALLSFDSVRKLALNRKKRKHKAGVI